jgi:putative transcription antitermination factor YqgF
MFDILGIDWGSVRFGLAFGCSKTGLVLPCKYDCFYVEIWKVLEREVSERKIKIIILGMPMTRQLRDTEVSLKVKEFCIKLVKNFPDLQIETINERNTTANTLTKILINPTKNKETSKHGINHNSACEIINLWLESKTV